MVDKNGNHDIKVGFSEPRSDGSSNAKIANILEYGTSSHSAKPFLKPAKSAVKKQCVEAMKSAFEKEAEGYDSFELHDDNAPTADVQEVRISLFTKGNYARTASRLVKVLLSADITVTARKYVGHEDDTGYHHYAVDTAKNYEMEEI